MSSALDLPLVRQFIPTAPQDRVLKFSPNGAYFVASGSSYFGASPLTVYERETWTPVVTLSAVSFTFSPDSETPYLLAEIQ